MFVLKKIHQILKIDGEKKIMILYEGENNWNTRFKQKKKQYKIYCLYINVIGGVLKSRE